jgi:hypothetical protein
MTEIRKVADTGRTERHQMEGKVKGLRSLRRKAHHHDGNTNSGPGARPDPVDIVSCCHHDMTQITKSLRPLTAALSTP